MKRTISMLSLLLAAAAAPAQVIPGHEETIQDYSWTQLQAEGKTLPGEASPAGGAESFETLKVASDGAQPRAITLLEIESPRITRAQYILRGQVKCEGVEGQGFLEMWNHFPGGGAFFSRTLAPSEPMGALSGSQGWRAFELPFMNQEGAPAPTRLVFNVVLPGKGIVWVSGVRLAQYNPNTGEAGGAASPGGFAPVDRAALARLTTISVAAVILLLGISGAMWVKRGSRETLDILAAAFVVVIAGYVAALAIQIVPMLRALPPGREGAWWGDQAAGLVGGSAGGLLGMLGAMIGVFTSMGVGRKAVIGALYGMAGLGVVSLIAGVFALATGQPYAVWYPLGLIGVLETVLAASFIPKINRRYQEMELRKMSAMDAGGGK